MATDRKNDNPNLALWSEVEKTNPNFTRRYPARGGGSLTATTPMYKVWSATKQWGPMGERWGIRNTRYVYRENPSDFKYNFYEFHGEFYYPGTDGAEVTIEISTDISLWEQNKDGAWRRISDPIKKARTDATSKVLSWLGFGADVHLGLFDDHKYVNRLQKEFSNGRGAPVEEKAAAPAVKIFKAEQIDEKFKKWMTTVLSEGKTASDVLAAIGEKYEAIEPTAITAIIEHEKTLRANV